jgi:DNA polymerase III delta' subunit
MPGDNVKFSSIHLQDEVVRFLRGSISNRRVSQTYLFAGGRSIGKARTACVFAATLQCLEPKTDETGLVEACGKCLSCKRILADTHPDVMLIAPLGKDIRIDQVRRVQEMAHLNAFMGKWKIFIFEETDRLNEFSANSLLKMLEEAPSRVIFILLVENPKRLLPTIYSRSTTVFFRAPSFHECRTVVDQMFPGQIEQVYRRFALAEGLLGRTIDWMKTSVATMSEIGDGEPLPDAQVRYIGALRRASEDACNRLRESQTPEELWRRLSELRYEDSPELLEARKDFLFGLAQAPDLPAAMPLLLSRLLLDSFDGFRNGVKKGIERVLTAQKQQYSAGILRELEESMSSTAGELLNHRQVTFLEASLNVFGDIFRGQCADDETTLLNIDRKEDIMRIARRWPQSLIRQRIAAIGGQIERIRRYVSPQLVFENFFADFGGHNH